MMKIAPFDKIICRTPAFGVNQTLAEVWEQLKLKIEESSPSFYELIKNLNHADLKMLDERSRFTIWKYLNRAKFRSTPYGTFAGFSFLKSAEMELADGIVVQKRQDIHEFVDWPEKNKLHLDYAGILKSNVLLFSNSSYYHT